MKIPSIRSFQKCIVGLILLAGFCQSQAMVPPQIASTKKTSHYLSEGAIVGGLQGRELSLLNLDLRAARQQPVERIEIVLGEANGEPLAGPIGYYHIAVLKNPPRVVVDLAQVQRTKMDEKALRKRLVGSRFIRSTDFTMDPEDLSTNLTFHLQHPMQVEAFEKVNLQGHKVLALDLRDGETGHK